jgi:hypothetical protein
MNLFSFSSWTGFNPGLLQSNLNPSKFELDPEDNLVVRRFSIDKVDLKLFL